MMKEGYAILLGLVVVVVISAGLLFLHEAEENYLNAHVVAEVGDLEASEHMGEGEHPGEEESSQEESVFEDFFED